MVSRIFYPRKTRKTRRPDEFVPRRRSELSRKWVGIWVRADSGVSRNEPLNQRRGFFLLCPILEAIFQVVPHFTFLPPEGQALPIALHRHQKSPRYELINQDRTRLTQRKKSLLSERASIAFGWSPAKPATAFRILFAGNPHPCREQKTPPVFPPVKRFVRLCRMGRGVEPS